MSKSELYRLAVQRGEPLPDDIAQLNARVAMLSEAIKEIWYSNSTPIALLFQQFLAAYRKC